MQDNQPISAGNLKQLISGWGGALIATDEEIEAYKDGKPFTITSNFFEMTITSQTCKAVGPAVTAKLKCSTSELIPKETFKENSAITIPTEFLPLNDGKVGTCSLYDGWSDNWTGNVMYRDGGFYIDFGVFESQYASAKVNKINISYTADYMKCSPEGNKLITLKQLIKALNGK